MSRRILLAWTPTAPAPATPTKQRPSWRWMVQDSSAAAARLSMARRDIGEALSEGRAARALLTQAQAALIGAACPLPSALESADAPTIQWEAAAALPDLEERLEAARAAWTQAREDERRTERMLRLALRRDARREARNEERRALGLRLDVPR